MSREEVFSVRYSRLVAVMSLFHPEGRPNCSGQQVFFASFSHPCFPTWFWCPSESSEKPGVRFEVACAAHLKEYMPEVKGRAKLGVQAFADAMLVIPKTLADNGGHDPQDTVIALQEAHEAGELAGVNLEAGGVLDPMKEGIYDAFMVKRQSLHLTSVIASQFLLTDEILKAGKKMGKGGPSMPGMD